MGFRDKTYVIFDGDNDMYAYAYMKGWKKNENMDFDFEDAHDLNEIRNGTQEVTVKRKLRERLANTKQACVLVGQNTKNLYRYVRWEIEVCQESDIPLVVVNLNDKRIIDYDRCPAILLDSPAMHVGYRAKIIKHALDEFCPLYKTYYKPKGNNWIYPESTYRNLGL